MKMKQETRWWYQKRIRDLEHENSILRPYRNLCFEIFEALTNNHMRGSRTNEHWIIRNFRQVFK